MISLNLGLVVQIVNVLVLMLLLHYILFRPLRKLMGDRDQEIADAKGRAIAIDREVSEKVAAYETRLRELKVQASGEKAEIVKKAHQEEGAILEKARAEAAAAISTIKNKVAKEASDAKLRLREDAQALSRDISEKILGRSL